MESQITFVGTILEFSGNDGATLESRLAQAEKNDYKCSPYLKCRSVSVRRRLALLVSIVFSSALWLLEAWQLTKQRDHLESWGARIVAQVCATQLNVSEDMGRATRLHAFAGHIAHSSHDLVMTSSCIRCLAWWRFRQARDQSNFGGFQTAMVGIPADKPLWRG